MTVFESNPKLGGMLRYGLPEYKIPNDVLDYEINAITGRDSCTVNRDSEQLCPFRHGVASALFYPYPAYHDRVAAIQEADGHLPRSTAVIRGNILHPFLQSIQRHCFFTSGHYSPSFRIFLSL